MNDYHTKCFFKYLLCVFLGVLSASTVVQAAKDKATLDERVVRSHDLLMEMMTSSTREIPTQVIAQSKAIVFVDQVKATFLVGLKGGYALAMLHNGEGGWSPPAFYRAGGVSFGLQAGGQRRQAILFIMNKEGTRMLTGDSGELGVDIGIAAGPTGANKDYSNITEIPVLAYTKTSGLYAGVSLKGTVFSPNNDDNRQFYGYDKLWAIHILEGKVDMPSVAKPLAEQLSQYVEDGLKKLEEQ